MLVAQRMHLSSPESFQDILFIFIANFDTKISFLNCICAKKLLVGVK